MRKITTVLVTITMFFTMIINSTAYSQNVLTVSEITTNPKTFAIKVLGTATPKERITVTVFPSSENDTEIPSINEDIVAQLQIAANENGEYTAEFKLNK
ncbi:MAG: hypothetical protein RR957_08300, partial [Oscillospiraceae bacterium]